MDIAEKIVCALVGCGKEDISNLFGQSVRSGIFPRAVKDASSFEAGDLWRECVWQSMEEAFDGIEPYEAEFSYSDPHVYMDSDVVEEISNFSEKAGEFERLSGFPITVKEV